MGARNAYGVTTGSYQYIDANGLLQTVNYIADPVNGFRVAGTNLPVAAAAPAVEPLAAPVFDLPLPVAVEDTAAAAAAAAPEEAAERRDADADEEVAPVAVPAVLPYPYAGAYGVGAGLFGGVYAAAPGAIVANIAHAAPTVAALPAATYAAAPIAAPLAAPAVAATYAAAPLAAAAPSREAVLTTVKLNPGHAISYRVDYVL